MTTRVRRVGIVTSGGDSPGYNPFVRAVVRMALHHDWEPWGVHHGYQGLVAGDFVPLSSRSVSGIIGFGGTFLGSSRSDTFNTARGLRDALRNVNEVGIDALVIIGGDGTMRGAHTLHEAGIPVIGVPGTIENDVCNTDVSIGVDTALNTALDAMDRIRDTASSQQQVFIVEMMGAKSGYLALMAGIAGGAEVTCIPEVPFDLEDVTREVADAYIRGKQHCIITVSEGAQPHAGEIAAHLAAHEAETGFGARLSILGHIQRGGSPSAYDRYLATRLGAAAIEQLAAGNSGVMMGIIENEVVACPLAELVGCVRHIDEGYLEMARVLAR